MNRNKACKELIKFWSVGSYSLGENIPGIHPHDKYWSRGGHDLGATVHGLLDSDKGLESIDELLKRNPKKLDSSMVPVPYAGDLRNGTIFLLMANPGRAEHQVEIEPNSEFRQALINNLRQEGNQLPFLYSDRRFKDTAGFKYWEHQRGLGNLIQQLAEESGWGEAKARAHLINHLVVLQAVPYHSDKLPGKPRQPPTSSRYVSALAQAIAREAMANGRALVICARSHAWWGTTFNDARRDEGPVLIGNKGHGGFTFGPRSLLPWREAVIQHLLRLQPKRS